MSENDCLDEEQLLAFAWGHLEEAQIEAVTAHLDRCRGCRLQVAAAAAVAADDDAAGRGTERSTRSFGRGEIIGGRYRIERFIARGGMGEVYEARDQLLDTRIALKTVAAAISDDGQATNRLKNEVQIARRVTHDNVCRLFDLGVHAIDPRSAVPGTPPLIFITMELLEGQTLRQYLRHRGRLPPDEVAALLRQLIAGLEAAHQAGVVHRDLKSDNIMLVPGAPGRRRLVIMDFGLARFGADTWASTDLSARGAMLGTMAYMAPEQIRGIRATAATDIYALGVVTFEMLIGMLPFRAETPLSAALMRLDQDPPSPRTLVPDLSAAWETLVMRCLARDPDARFRSVAELAVILREIEGRSEAEDPPAMANGRWRPRARLAVLVVALASVVAAGVALLVVRSRPQPATNQPTAAARPVAPAVTPPAPVPPPPFPPPPVAAPPVAAARAIPEAPVPAAVAPRRRIGGGVPRPVPAPPAATSPAPPDSAPPPRVESPAAAPSRKPRVNDDVIDPFNDDR